MIKSKTINVKGTEVKIFQSNEEDFISLSSIARYRDPERSDYIVQNWMRNRNTIEFIGLWEQLHNPEFNSIEFDGVKGQAGANSFSLTPKKWIETTGAIGIISKEGRNGGTFAHHDIAFEFASWISPEFKLYLITEFQRLKKQESHSLDFKWDLPRFLTKVNYHIHTSAVREYLIPRELDKNQVNFVYASEADLLNTALFGVTAKQWKAENKNTDGNIRDTATIEQLVVLSNLESMNSVMIHQGLTQSERLPQLNNIAISQMRSLLNNKQVKQLK